MTKQVITVHGEERVVREDTAKAFRGVHWALLSLLAFIVIAAILFFSGALRLATSPDPTPLPTESRPATEP
jgi:hypothetical protein